MHVRQRPLVNGLPFRQELDVVDSPRQFGNSSNFSRKSAQAADAMHGRADEARQRAEPPQDDGRAPKKRKRPNQFVVFLNLMFSLLIFGLIGIGAILYLGQQAFEGDGPLRAEAVYTVPSGASIAQIANGLASRGIIEDSRLFRLGVRAYKNETTMKAGEYAFAPGISMKEVMEKLVEGRAIQQSVTIVEGMTVFKAFERIAANEALVGDMPSELPPEGSLVADTVLFQRGMERADIVARMRDAQSNLVAEIWATRRPDLPIADINEFVTLASIVEKETGVAGERPEVAGVFINRLRRGMRLQSDPTIIYGIFGGAGKPSDRPIYRSDIDTPTPYNTYTIDGLPPGPIAIPGRAALEAVANPADTPALYFVADGTGGHAFAETLDEHNANVRKWREIERQREAEAGQ